MTLAELAAAVLGTGAITQAGNYLLGRRRAASDETTLYRTALEAHVTRLDASIASLQARVDKLEADLALARKGEATALADAEALAEAKHDLTARLAHAESDLATWRDRAKSAEATVLTLQEQLDHERAHHSER